MWKLVIVYVATLSLNYFLIETHTYILSGIGLISTGYIVYDIALIHKHKIAIKPYVALGRAYAAHHLILLVTEFTTVCEPKKRWQKIKSEGSQALRQLLRALWSLIKAILQLLRLMNP